MKDSACYWGTRAHNRWWHADCTPAKYARAARQPPMFGRVLSPTHEKGTSWLNREASLRGQVRLLAPLACILKHKRQATLTPLSTSFVHCSVHSKQKGCWPQIGSRRPILECKPCSACAKIPQKCPKMLRLHAKCSLSQRCHHAHTSYLV